MDTITTLGAIFTSFVICQLIFHFVSSWFSAKVSPRFNDLSSEKKIKWNSRVVSTCEALVVGIFSLCIFLFHEAATVNLHWDAAWLGNVNIAIITGYLISDLLLLLFYWRVIGRIYFVIHSCAALYLCFLVLKEGLPAYIWNIRLIVHLSNLFYYQRWFLKTLGYSQSSEAYLISGVIMTVMFVIVRIAVIPPFYYCFYSMYGTYAYIRLGLLIQSFWLVGSILYDLTNIIGMIRIIMEWVHLSQDILSHQTRESNQKSSL